MGADLDLDDVAAQSPRAKRELDELRTSLRRAEEHRAECVAFIAGLESRALAAEKRAEGFEKQLDDALKVIVGSYEAIRKDKADYLKELMDWVDKALEAREALRAGRGE